MQIIQRPLPLDHNLFLFGDDHEGTTLRHDEGWKLLVKMMLSEYAGCSNNFGLDHGDAVDFIPSSDKRWYESEESCKCLDQIEKAIEHRKPIKEILVALLDGNHPMQYHRFGNVTLKICKALGIEYGTYSAHITYLRRSGVPMYRQYATHGFGSIRSNADDTIRQDANKKLSLKRKLKNKFADVVLCTMGHTHKLLIAEPTKELYLNCNQKISQHYTTSHQADEYIPPDHRWYVNTGSFLRLYGKGFSGYAERAGYDPLELGFAIARVRNGVIQGIDKIILETPKEE
jgi:hypothetical protein